MPWQRDGKVSSATGRCQEPLLLEIVVRKLNYIDRVTMFKTKQPFGKRGFETTAQHTIDVQPHSQILPLRDLPTPYSFDPTNTAGRRNRSGRPFDLANCVGNACRRS
jgi:hypothetical protein